MRSNLILLLFLLWSCGQTEHSGSAIDHSDKIIFALLLQDQFAEAQDSLVVQMARPQVQGKVERQANNTYYQALLHYQAGDLPLAMKDARSAVSQLSQLPESTEPLVLVRSLHLLAQLHFDHAAHTDSIGFYQRWAAGLMPTDAPETIQAEQQLCYALAQLYDYEYKTQLAAARLGKSLLTNHPELNDTYARLLVAEGLGLKKHADRQPDSVRFLMLEQAADLMTEAVTRFQKINSIRWREAQREKVIIVSRFKDRERFEQCLAPLLLPTSTAPAHRRPNNPTAKNNMPLPFGFPDRLRGYFHQTNQHVDSTIYYYLKFQPDAPEFDFHLNDETHWTLIQYGIKGGELDLARRNVRDQMVLYRCLDESQKKLPHRELLRQTTFGMPCAYALCDYGRIKLAEYTDRNNPQALANANEVFQLVLSEWESIFASGEEESALNQLSEITYKIINNANEAAYLLYRKNPTAANANQLLQTTERTKAFLLLNDRFKRQANSDFTAKIDSLKKWQSQLNILKEREARAGSLSAEERRKMQQLRDRYLVLQASVRSQRLNGQNSGQRALPGLDVIRQELSPGRAILTFSTGNNRLIGQYHDRDTTIVFTTPPETKLALKIKQYRELLKADAGSVYTHEYAPIAHDLFLALFGPCRQRLLRIKDLLILPAGPLRQLPFGTLLTEPSTARNWSELPYLLAGTSIAYTTSLRLERLNAGLRPASFQQATVGTWTHPDFALTFQRSRNVLQRLAPASSRFFDQADCSTTAFRQKLNDYDIVNLALHASGDPYNAYRNHLYFSLTDSLNGAAISQLNTNAKLVLLTACETGLGTTTVGEGTFSIARGFQQLGVPDVVYSLYPISAGASDELMQRFYHHLFSGLNATASLTRARRDMMLGKRGMVFAFPGYWGGVVGG